MFEYVEDMAVLDEPPLEEPLLDDGGRVDARRTLDYIAAELPGPDELRVLCILNSMRDELSADELVDLVLQFDRYESWLAANKQLTLAACAATASGTGADATRNRRAYEDMVLELGLGLRWSEGMVYDRLDVAVQLSERLPATWTALARGTINFAKARLIAHGAGKLGDDAKAHALEERVLRHAGEQIQREVEKSVERAVMAIDPEGAEERRQRTRRDRRVTRRPLEDGGAHLGVSGPAEDIAVIHAALTNGAQSLQTLGQVDSLDQGRFDTLLSWAIGQLDERGIPFRGPRPVGATIIVKGSTAAGVDDDPAEVAGFGPITAQTDRDLLAGKPPPPGPFDKWNGTFEPPWYPRDEERDPTYLAEERRQRQEPPPPDEESPPDDWQWQPPPTGTPPPRPVPTDPFAVAWRVLKVDPATGWAVPPAGARLNYGTTRRYATPVQARFVRDRDRTCGIPICGQTGGQVDIDHRVESARGGPTDVVNLGPGCRHHNRTTRNASDWTIDPQADGTATLTTPQGRKYRIKPHDYLR